MSGTTTTTVTANSSADALELDNDKDLEIHSVHASSSDGEVDEKRRQEIDVEACIRDGDEKRGEEGKGVLERVVARMSTKGSWKDPGPPPDGGWNAWLQALIGAGLSFAWIAVSSRGGFYAWTIVYGIAGASIQGLFPVTLSSLTTDLAKAGTRMGQVFTVVSFAVLTGPPIAGQLIQRKNGGYLYAQLFAGTNLIIGAILMVASRMLRT
ncbi:hypothetical protein G7Y89_g12623 [Cudoniella acicularis]|uniref:Major facilitator superfamily (MFS) profile domain-containing protein n=1 Tax=Cudoniella acicularis TaxID=354080 RepID=A0A8H4RA30_9HELO|nr:hypothetical protein G7Y89_g12623 [Cudoniella acicularis]